MTNSKENNIGSLRRALCISYALGFQGHFLTKSIAFKILEICSRVNYKLGNVYLKIKKNKGLILFSYQNLEIICYGFNCMFIF